ncbi:MAG: NADPH-dependent oxidoreductase [Microcella sp.]
MPTDDTVSPADHALRARYGDQDARWRGPWNDTIATMIAHRSVRRFAEGDVDDDTLSALIAAAQSASTSSNLQSWSVVAVRDGERKRQLRELAADQSFIEQAPVVLVWLADFSRAQQLADAAGVPLAAAELVESTIVGVVDAALAAQNALVAAESLGLGGVYIGAMRNRPDEVAELLGLPARTFAVFGLAVGHPDPADRAGVKPRLPQAAVLHHERYDASRVGALLDTHEQAQDAYNATQGRHVSWRQAVLRRLSDYSNLSGRERLRSSLERRGLPSR